MVGSTSEVMESGKDIGLCDADIKVDPLIMLNTDIESIKNSNDETQSSLEVIMKTEVEEQPEHESNALERFIIVEEAVEEVSTSYDEHILEICQDEDMNTEQYEDFGYESLSSPEYECRTHYAPLILTDLLS